MKRQLKELGERIINDNYAMINYADDPEWLKDHLWMFQGYNPGLFHEQLKEFLQRKLPRIDVFPIIEFFKDCNNNTQVKEIKNSDNFKSYGYAAQKRYNIPIKLIFEDLLRNLRINAAYCKDNNIVFIQIQQLNIRD